MVNLKLVDQGDVTVSVSISRPANLNSLVSVTKNKFVRNKC